MVQNGRLGRWIQRGTEGRTAGTDVLDKCDGRKWEMDNGRTGETDNVDVDGRVGQHDGHGLVGLQCGQDNAYGQTLDWNFWTVDWIWTTGQMDSGRLDRNGPGDGRSTDGRVPSLAEGARCLEAWSCNVVVRNAAWAVEYVPCVSLEIIALPGIRLALFLETCGVALLVSKCRVSLLSESNIASLEDTFDADT